MSPDPSPQLQLAQAEMDPAEVEDYEISNPNWPITRLASLALTVGLWFCLVAPELAANALRQRMIVLLVPAALATLVARLLYETIGPAATKLTPGRAAAGGGAAVTAAAVMWPAAAIIGVSWSPVLAGITSAASFALLLGAGHLRDREISDRLSLRRVFFVGSSAAQRDLERELRRSPFASFVGAGTIDLAPDPERLLEAVGTARATVLVLDHDAMRLTPLVSAAVECRNAGMQVRELVDYYESEFKKVPVAELTPAWFLFDLATVHGHPLVRGLRRAWETALAALLLILATPLLAAGWLAVRLTSPGPGVYRQQRVGKDGKPFTMLKLRTMTEGDGSAQWAGSQTHRVTSVGRVLRRYRLDELPQLWNVLRGDLALVGPRPEQVPIVERLEREIPFYSARHAVRPGLTGWAQVNMGYGGSAEGTLAKLQRDLYYVKHAGWRLDCLILWLTLKAILSDPGTT